ncbi:GTPase [Streptomyces sp. NPDC048409]|uniref:GTPase n=1 Tax=Streptomyces sp. NPDC048409 TaxID=3154723 RepID=UPI003423FED1
MTAVTDHDHTDRMERMDHTGDYTGDRPGDDTGGRAADREGGPTVPGSAPEPGREPAREPGRQAGRRPGRAPGRETDREAGRETVPDPAHDPGQDPVRAAAQDTAKGTAMESVRDSGRDAGQGQVRGREPGTGPAKGAGTDASAPDHRGDTAPRLAKDPAPEASDDRREGTGADPADRTGTADGTDTETVPHARGREQREQPQHEQRQEPGETGGDGEPGAEEDVWDDGLIARRVTETAKPAVPVVETRGPGAPPPAPLAYEGPLRSRLDALRELVGLSRTRLDSQTLSEAGRVLDEAAARRRLSGQHTVIAIAGATGSGKSQLFNALAGVAISETGVRRPTTASPIACSWSDGSAALIDRLGIPGRLRRRPVHNPEADAQLRGLILIDLPDHDSAVVQHREHVDRILKLVDAVIWVVDPEKYADAVLHERYLRPLSGHAEVMFIVLNQTDRLPGEAADLVLDDLRRVLDEDGVALGEYGEPGATVLALSALTGDGVGELRETLGQFVSERGAAARRVAADVDAAAAGLRPVYATGRRAGLSEEAREDFAARLADAVGATAAGEAAERAWLRNANRACGTPWLRLWRWHQGRADQPTGRLQQTQPEEEATARQRVEQAVRTVSDRASAGLPAPWAQAVREAAVRGSQGLPEALDDLATQAGLPPGRPPRPGWWPVAVLAQAAMTLLQVVGGLWLVAQIAGVMAPNLGVPVLLMVAGIIGGPLVEWGCRMAARGPARRYGLEAERRLREAAAGCGRARVLDPVAAELLRYQEVREQYARVTGTGAGVG